jgi:ADP-heptose:LPS heptosyltransferase
MATSQVRRLYARTGRKVCIIDRRGLPRWNDVFDHNPKLTKYIGAQHLLNAPGVRPYIAAKTSTRWTWQRWDIEPGEIFLADDELAFAESYRGMVLIEPTTKVPGGNKAWRPERWQQVVDAMPAVRFVQTGPPDTPWLHGVKRVATTFRQACAVLSVCRACVVPEGALHHAAAALDVPAVVLWSEFIAPEFTGYATQRNIRHAGDACGSRVHCHECAVSMARITVDEVVTNLQESL